VELKIRNRGRFARVGLLCVALLICLGITGVGYAGWTATAFVDGNVETGSWGGSLGGLAPTSPNITLIVVSPGTLGVSVSYTVANAAYTGSFEVSNTGTVPIKVDSIAVHGLPAHTTGIVSGVSAGAQIEPGETKYADVNTSSSIEGDSYSFTVTLTFKLWNGSICPA
jgi:hypothetical protein